ncbi:outer membrane protein P6 precursor [mine drainage metagenome]|uniref:Outer membrane protein P6 n=1 Tax=mine drainage metagenome TaxID=410659 RepID=A0A1J5R6C3_9ZZZZ
MRLRTLPAVCAALLALGGCSSVRLNKAPVEAGQTTATGAAAGTGASSQGAGAVASIQAEPLAPGAAGGDAGSGTGPAADVARSVYFGYDSYVVDAKYHPVLAANAQYLSAHPSAHAQLQGNTDARGSREYNLALGQKRADAVMKGLEVLGTSPSQLEAISFGKEKPRSEGSTQADYAENRRVDIVYK